MNIVSHSSTSTYEVKERIVQSLTLEIKIKISCLAYFRLLSSYYKFVFFRKDKLMGRITIGFLSNLIIAFIIRLSDDWQTRRPCEEDEDIEGTLECAVKGYLKQYFFLVSYMFPSKLPKYMHFLFGCLWVF